MKRAGSVSQMYRTKDPDPEPDPYENVTDPEHSLLHFFFYKYIFSLWKQQLEMHLQEENLTENHTTLRFQKSIQNNPSTRKA
jgi:hypothetical protein